MKYRLITSSTNPLIKDSLNILKKNRRKRPAVMLIEGVRLIETALQAGARIERVFFTESMAAREEGLKMLEMFGRRKDRVFEISDRLMDRLSDTESPQGIVAVVSYRPTALEEVKMSARPLVTVLDGLQDPGNLGTIIRTSDAAGADAVVLLPGTCDPFTPKPLRASAGSVFNIPVVETELATLMKWTKEKGLLLLVTARDAADTLYEADLERPVAFAFGNEAHGASRELRKAADLVVGIPVYGKAESLNVGSAAAICLYEAVRKRRASQS
jgi:TrmH family RNA methyltransferase